MRYQLVCVFIFLTLCVSGNIHLFKDDWDHLDEKYSTFPEAKRLEMLAAAREMFSFGYDNYMTHAFPQDELDPIHCTGRGPDYDNPSNININDVLGDYALTLVDSLDTLAIMGNSSGFQHAVQLVIDTVSFDKSNIVQVFEATIRVLGGLLSAHLIITDPAQPFGDMAPPHYDNELLSMAHDLAARLLPAFEETATGIPFPRVNLREGVPADCTNTTCTSGAGSLLVEFGLLSRLLGDPVYEAVARRAVQHLWNLRSNVTGLFGNIVHIQTGQWVGTMSGLGAGLDSFFEYLLKSFILFGEKEDLAKFNESYATIKYYMRRGRMACNQGSGFPPIYVNVNMKSGDILNNWIDALQAAWPGVQVLSGDIEEAICAHAIYYAIWQRFDALPERFNWNLKTPEVFFYPLRPELVESTYLLYQATKNPFYLHVGSDILNSLNNHTRVKCGYATIHDVRKKDLEDRMESFFLSETCKYLYLLFDKDNYLNKHASKYLFTTEGHILPILPQFRTRPWDNDIIPPSDKTNKKTLRKSPTAILAQNKGKSKEESGSATVNGTSRESGPSEVSAPEADTCDPSDKPSSPPEPSQAMLPLQQSNLTSNCQKIPTERTYFLPLQSRYLQQIIDLVGTD